MDENFVKKQEDFMKSYEREVRNSLVEIIENQGAEVAANYVINMIASFHSTRGGAIYSIGDYLNTHEI